MEDGQARKSFIHHPQLWLAVLLTVGEMALIYTVFFVGVPEANQRIADVLVGSYTAVWAEALRYWYGTTFGSNAKNEIIAKAEPVKD